MTAADTFHFRSRGLLRPVETPGPVLRTPPRITQEPNFTPYEESKE